MAPTDEELLELMPQGFRDDLALVSRMASHGAGPEVQPGLFRVTLNTGALDYARAVWDRARAALAAESVAAPAEPTDEAAVEAAAELIYMEAMEWAARQSIPSGHINIPAWQQGGNSDAQEVARRTARAVMSRFGRPAPAPDDRGVLPMIVSETGADDEPELERIICASISGGADYVNSVPRELRLERITPEGSTFARYIQVDADARPDVRPAPAPAEVLSARPLLEQIAALSDCIGEQTVGQVIAIADRAAAWLSENPPGKPAAIEPRGCPTPGACSCVELPAPAPAGEVEQDPVPVAVIERPWEPARHTILVPAPVPVAVSERPWERDDWVLDPDGECWWCPHDGPAYWTMANPAMVYGGWLLPASALPIPYSALLLPSGEVEA